MATLAVRSIDIDEIGIISSENEICSSHSLNVTKTGINESSENIGVNLMKKTLSNDSGILMNKSISDVSSSILEEENYHSINTIQLVKKPVSKSSISVKEDEQSENNQFIINDRCLQDNSASSNDKDSNLSILFKTDEISFDRHNDSSSHVNIHNDIKKDDNFRSGDENYCLSMLNSSLNKTNQNLIDVSYNKNSKLNYKVSNLEIINKKKGENLKQNLLEDNDSLNIKNSQNIIKKLNNKSNSVSVSHLSIQQNLSSNQTKKFSKISNNVEEESSNHQFSIIDSIMKITTEPCQSVIEKSDNESNSKQSKSSSEQSSPEKQSINSSNFKTNENISFISEEKNEPLSSIILLKDNTSETQNIFRTNQSKKYFNILDSDSEEELIDFKNLKYNQKSDDLHITSPKKSLKSLKTVRRLLDSDSDGEDFDKIHKNKNAIEKKNFQSSHKSNKISSVVDSDSDEVSNSHSEFKTQDSSDEKNYTDKTMKEKKKSKNKRMGSARASKDMAMQQIHSETQRLIRESEISLPYHRPKQRTLQEFLNRKKIISEIPKNLTCAEKVKMFPEMISKVIEEKEKEAEIFYKSSDSEEDEKCNEIMEMNVKKKNEIESIDDDKNSDKTTIAANIKKYSQNEIKESINKTENLQQRSLDFGVSRKLFMEEDINDIEKDKDVQEPLEHSYEKENKNSSNIALFKMKAKTSLRECSITQKLFINNIVNVGMDIDNNDNNDNCESILEEKILDNEKPLENNKKTISSENVDRENSTEEIVLNMSETELDNSETMKEMKSNIISDSCVQKNYQESITIPKNSFISNKEFQRKDGTSIISINSNDIKNQTVNTDESKQLDDLNEDLEKNKDDSAHIIDPDILKIDFSVPFDLDETSTKRSIKDQILANALKVKPMIKGSPGSIIDFTSSGEMKEGVNQLLNRFARHSVVIKPKLENITEVKILNMEGEGKDINVIEETLHFKRTLVEDEDNKEHKPGEKLKKLREELKRKIATVRHEEWKHKEEYENEDEEDFENGSDDYYAGLPDEEELLEDEENSESEPEENDVLIVDKPKSKCQFADEEAEETDNEDMGDVGEREEDDDEEEEEEEEEENEEKEENEDDYEENKENKSNEEEQYGKIENNNNGKKLKRIVKPFEEDSNQSESSLSNDAHSRLSFDRTKTDEDMFASQTSTSNASEDIDGIPPFQPRNRCNSDSRSQACKTPLPKPTNILSMISPVAQLTALNASLGSARKSASKMNSLNFGQADSSLSHDYTITENSDRPESACSLGKMMSLTKKLFDDPPETVHDDELLDICSGKFTETQSLERVGNNKENEVSDSQLMELCSGAFVTQPIDMQKLESAGSNVQVADDASQDITLTLDDEENDRSTNSPVKMSSSMKRSDESIFSNDSKSPVKAPVIATTTFKNPMEAWLQRANEKSASASMQQQKRDEVTDSELINLCSGSFATQPIDMKDLEQNETQQRQDSEDSQDLLLYFNNNSKSSKKEVQRKETTKDNKNDVRKQKTLKPILKETIVNEEEKTSALWAAYTIMSSDDEDLKKYNEKHSRMKKKGLQKKKVQKLMLSDDEDNKSDELSEEEEEEIFDDDNKYIDYDSDENEIVVVHKKEIKKVAANFLDKEAELSESDWDSADEDEHGMDKLDLEEGDMENFDESKMKKQLDKIHVKRMLDQDKKEVKMLQELLFDDGDLHDGAGRERRFKWKNIDNIDDGELVPRTNDDDDEIDDEVDTEVEAQMRKIRYEQQKFLEEQEKNVNTDKEDFAEKNLFKLGLKVVSLRSSIKSSLGNPKTNKNNLNNNKNLLLNTNSSFSSEMLKSSSLSFSSMRGSFLSRGEDTLVRIAQNLPESNKKIINPLRNKNFVFEHLSPSVSKDSKNDLEQGNDTPSAKETKKTRKRKMFLSQTPKTTKKLKVDERTAGKRLF